MKKAKPIFREKRIVSNQNTGDIAIVEIKIWSIPKSKHYPIGQKFSLFLISRGKIVVGIDNHKPKGPHLHLGNKELTFEYSTVDKLLADFWDLTRKAGYKP